MACSGKKKGHTHGINPKFPVEFHAVNSASSAPTFDGEVEAAQPVPRQGIGAALQDNGAGLERLHHFGDHLNNKAPVTPCPQATVTAAQ